MPLPAPNLDDRRFQDLVDDAKRMVQQRCPEHSLNGAFASSKKRLKLTRVSLTHRGDVGLDDLID